MSSCRATNAKDVITAEFGYPDCRGLRIAGESQTYSEIGPLPDKHPLRSQAMDRLRYMARDGHPHCGLASELLRLLPGEDSSATDRDPMARARCLALLQSLRDLGHEAVIFEDNGPTVMVADRQLRPTRKPGVPDAWRVYCDRYDEPWVCSVAHVLEDRP